MRQKYPTHLLGCKYDPQFAIRGLHFDVTNGVLMKLDAFRNIQLNAVFRGRTPVSISEVISYYRGTHVSQDYLSHYMYQLTDLFSLPEACLIADVIQYFSEQRVRFDPRYVLEDVKACIRSLHESGEIHAEVVGNMDKYLRHNPVLLSFLSNLKSQGKKLFILTNSSFEFIDAGLRHVLGVGENWRELFDAIVVKASKPSFFKLNRQFCQFDRATGRSSWDRVSKLVPGEVYQEGNLPDFEAMTNWQAQSTLYFGDHILSDLAEPMLIQGWRTGVVIKELEHEIDVRNSEESHRRTVWRLNLEELIRYVQILSDQESQATLSAWKEERDQVRDVLKNLFNKQFGSVFKAYQAPSFFATTIRTFADIYTSRVENLSRVPTNYCFYPEQYFEPHEAPLARHPRFGYRLGFGRPEDNVSSQSSVTSSISN